MKILFLSFYSGYVERGMETVVHELANRLSDRHEVTVIQAGPIKKFLRKYRLEKIPIDLHWQEVEASSYLRKYFVDYYSRKILGFTLKALAAIKLFKPDIIIPTNGGWQTLILKIYSLLGRSKLVILGQAGLGRDDRWNLMLRPDLFVALSTRNTLWAKENSSPDQKIVTIPNGVNLVQFKPSGSRYPLNLARPIVLCVAGPERYKRVKDTIMAVAQLKRGSLLLVCHSSGYDALGKEILGKRFLRQAFTHQQMPQVYRSTDVFTLVSEKTEAFGVAYLEAMATNLPIVATDDSSRREIIASAGLYIKSPQNSELYAQKLQQALRGDWGNLAAEQVKKFSWDIIASRYEKAFNQL